jgi:hypothetical protein
MRGVLVNRIELDKHYDATEYTVCLEHKLHIKYVVPYTTGAGRLHAIDINVCNCKPPLPRDVKLPEQFMFFLEKVLSGEAKIEDVRQELLARWSEEAVFHLPKQCGG